jgi:peptidoglycan/LPS O-acetylase OafA/YrhL
LKHVPALDGLRGIAILLVIGVHLNFAIPGGWLGVELFFVLSGFLITSLLIGEWSRTSAVSIRAFYRRRVHRLLPALVLLLTAYTAVIGGRQALGFGGDLGQSLSGVGYASIYLSNVVDPMSIPLELHHTWSLAQEEQFYLVWPLALLALVRFGAGPRVLAAFLVAVLVGTQAEFRINSLVIGCIAGVLFSYGLVTRVPMLCATIALAPAAALVWLFDYHSKSNEMILVFAIPCGIVVLAAATTQEWWAVRIFEHSVLRWFGKVSYGLYLWHWPLIVAVGWKLGVPLAIVVAALSYRFVEQPFLRRRSRTSDQNVRQPWLPHPLTPSDAPTG